jgi:hypothetical protein
MKTSFWLLGNCIKQIFLGNFTEAWDTWCWFSFHTQMVITGKAKRKEKQVSFNTEKFLKENPKPWDYYSLGRTDGFHDANDKDIRGAELLRYIKHLEAENERLQNGVDVGQVLKEATRHVEEPTLEEYEKKLDLPWSPMWGGKAIENWDFREVGAELVLEYLALLKKENWLFSKCREELVEQKDGAYSERNKLVAALSKLFPAWLAQHSPEDTGWESDWRNIVFIQLPTGQASWHIHDSEIELFTHLPAGPNAWDGHTNEEKYARVGQMPDNKAGAVGGLVLRLPELIANKGIDTDALVLRYVDSGLTAFNKKKRPSTFAVVTPAAGVHSVATVIRIAAKRKTRSTGKTETGK